MYSFSHFGVALFSTYINKYLNMHVNCMKCLRNYRADWANICKLNAHKYILFDPSGYFFVHRFWWRIGMAFVLVKKKNSKHIKEIPNISKYN